MNCGANYLKLNIYMQAISSAQTRKGLLSFGKVYIK